VSFVAGTPLIEDSGWREFPPRLPEQPIFYPITNEAYASQIAQDWNVMQDFLVEDRLISRVGDHLTGSLAEPKATTITHL
jgi:hypothetical protein